jgi:hypothetical protein
MRHKLWCTLTVVSGVTMVGSVGFAIGFYVGCILWRITAG